MVLGLILLIAREIISSPSFYFPYTLTPHFIFETPPEHY